VGIRLSPQYCIMVDDCTATELEGKPSFVKINTPVDQSNEERAFTSLSDDEEYKLINQLGQLVCDGHRFRQVKELLDIRSCCNDA